MKLFAAGLSLLLFVCLVRASRAATPFTFEAERNGSSAVAEEFMRMSIYGQPPASWWVDHPNDCTVGTDLATPTVLLRPQLAPLRSFVRGRRKYYVAEVCIKKFDLMRPAYLYLLANRRKEIEIIAAFHIEHGKARKIDR